MHTEVFAQHRMARSMASRRCIVTACGAKKSTPKLRFRLSRRVWFRVSARSEDQITEVLSVRRKHTAPRGSSVVCSSLAQFFLFRS